MPAVLIVEDTPAVLAPRESPLQRREVVLVRAASVERGIAELAGQRPDLLLVDLRRVAAGADDLGGSARSAGAACPVLLIADVGEREQATRLGADGLVTRPVTVGRLLEALRRWAPIRDRQSERVVLTVPVDLDHADESGQGILENVSAGGVLLTTRDRLIPGERVKVSFALPTLGSERVRAFGRVVRAASVGAPGRTRAAYGLRFESIPAMQRSEIVRWTRLRGAA